MSEIIKKRILVLLPLAKDEKIGRERNKNNIFKIWRFYLIISNGLKLFYKVEINVSG